MLRHGDSTLHDVTEIKIAEKNSRLRKVIAGKYVLAHRTNSLAKLQQALQAGFDGVELDIYYSDITKDLMVGHDGDNKDTSSGLPLSRYLALAHRTEYRRIWLDAKNLNPATAPHFMRLLNQLDQPFSFKKRAIIETAHAGEYVKTMTTHGWNVSYYIPTEGLTNPAKEERQRHCQFLAKEAKNAAFNAISFDSAFYEKVKKDCSALLGSLKFNSWILEKQTNDPSFLSALLKSALLSDHSLDTLIIPFESSSGL